MNVWLTAATALLPPLAAAGLMAGAARTPNRLVGLLLASANALFILVLLSVGYDQSSFIDLGLTLVLLSFPGAVVYAHFLERWL